MNSLMLGILLILNIAIGFLLFYSGHSKLLFSLSGAILIVVTEYMALATFGAYWNYYSSVVFLLISLVINLIPTIVLRRHIIRSIKNFKKPSLIPVPYIIALIVVMSTVMFTNGLFGMGQDQGCYQVKALALSEGETDSSIGLTEETVFLKSTEQFSDIRDFAGYTYKFYDAQIGMYVDNGLSGTIHGTTAYPALLALDVEVFGLRGMMNINYALVFISAVFLLEILSILNVNTYLGALALIIGIASPATIWTNKASLTESVQLPLTIAVVLGIVLATKNRRVGITLTTIAAIGYAVMHLSAFYFLPIVGVLLLVTYLRTNDRFAIICNQIITIFFVAAFFVESKLYYVYTYGNVTNTFNSILGKNISHETYLKVIPVLAIGLSLLTLVFLLKPVKKVAKKLMGTILYPLILVGVGAICALKILIYILSYSKQVDFPHAISSLTLFGITVSSGLIIFPIALILGIINIRKLMSNPKYESLMIAFVYFVIFLSSFAHPTIPHYYYYSRYFSTTVFLVPVVFALVTDKFVKNKKALYAAGVFGLLFILPYSSFVTITRDDSYMSYGELQKIGELFHKGDAVVFTGNDAQKMLMLPIKYTTDADVYVDIVSDEALLDEYENVYYLNVYDELYYGAKPYKQIDITLESDPQNPHKFFFPLYDFKKEKSTVNIYKLDRLGEEKYYIEADRCGLEGFNSPDIDFVWSSAKESVLTLDIPDVDFEYACIDFAEINYVVPEPTRLDDVTIYVNGKLCAKKPLEYLDSGIRISADAFSKDSDNEIKFVYETWSPKSVFADSTDDRNLGFAISGISFN